MTARRPPSPRWSQAVPLAGVSSVPRSVGPAACSNRRRTAYRTLVGSSSAVERRKYRPSARASMLAAT